MLKSQKETKSVPTKKIPYLCGSMSGLKGYGRRWRARETEWFIKHGMGVYNPCVEEEVFTKFVGYFTKQTDPIKWEELDEKVQVHIIRKDLDQIKEKTSFLLVYFTQYSTGTVTEMSAACYWNIPVYVVSKRCIKGWPGTAARYGRSRQFGIFRELHRYLLKEGII